MRKNKLISAIGSQSDQLEIRFWHKQFINMSTRKKYWVVSVQGKYSVQINNI